MSPREVVTDHGLLFGGNTLFEVLLAVARRRGLEFHGAAIAHSIGRTEAQTNRELAKLARLKVLETRPAQGRRKIWTTSTRPLAVELLAIPSLLESELGSYLDAA